jgi:hypothetical protein
MTLMKFDWLLDLLPAESVTRAPKRMATGVAETLALHGGARTTVDEVPHLPHLPHLKSGEAVNDVDLQDNLAEHLTERAAILEHDAGLDRAQADMAAVRIVQCSTCQHWTADPVARGGIGTCRIGANLYSWSALDRRPLPAWPNAPRYCTR